MDSGEFLIRPVECPDCGAPFPWDKPQCWLCGWKLGDPVTPGKKAQFRPKIIVEKQASHDNLTRTFSLSTIFLWMTLLVVVMGVVRIAPGLGILLAVFILPAALRTITTVNRRKRQTGETLSVPEKINAFFGWLGTLVAISVVAILAFCTAFFCICLAGAGKFLGSLEAVEEFAALAAAGFVVYCLWQLWRREDRLV